MLEQLPTVTARGDSDRDQIVASERYLKDILIKHWKEWKLVGRHTIECFNLSLSGLPVTTIAESVECDKAKV